MSIGTDGSVSVTSPGATTPTQVGQLQLVHFQNPAGLENQGRNLYMQTLASGSPVQTQASQNGAGLIRRGFLEGSNVDAVAEMVNLILAQRAYEFNPKAITTAEQMLPFTTNLIR
jgi:flagellar basal-body rod protein FlgG